ncbi:hypothetical protein ACF1AX_16595 [Streptomyces sp. NPDC014802]|uniref:hypothetical protein n=1 Tax=Streptomyces sp. NPDC014802 TaxID=3364917 RepID=UPI003702BCA3
MTWPDSSPVAWGPSSRTAAARSPPAAHPYSFRFRDALGKRREESGYGTQDDAIERLTQLYAVKKTTAPSVAAARRELGQPTVEEYAKQWRPRQQRMTDYSTGWHVDSSINVHIVPRMGARKLNSLKTVLRDAFAKGGHGGRPGEGSPGTGLRAGNGRHSLSRLRDEGTDRGR